MFFAHDTLESLQTMANLVNTAGNGKELLEDQEALTAFLKAETFRGSRTHDAGELAAVHGLRTRIRQFWELPKDDAAALVNAMLSEYRALPQLLRHDGLDWHLHATTHEAPLEDRMATEAAMAMLDVLRTGEFDRLRVCAAEDCDFVIVDLSKNRSKRFCDSTCASRTHVAAYRARRKEG